MYDTNKSNTIDDIIKSHKDLSTPTKIPQSVKKEMIKLEHLLHWIIPQNRVF